MHGFNIKVPGGGPCRTALFFIRPMIVGELRAKEFSLLIFHIILS